MLSEASGQLPIPLWYTSCIWWLGGTLVLCSHIGSKTFQALFTCMKLKGSKFPLFSWNCIKTSVN